MEALSIDHGRRIEELVRRHQRSVRGFLVFLGCPLPMLDDLVQDVFLSVLSSGFRDRGPEPTAAFLRKVARHLFLKAVQRERRAPVALDPAVLDPAGAEAAWAAFEADDGGHAYLAALRKCLAGVRGRAAEALRLRYRAGLGQASIGARLGLTESGAKSLLVRTRRKLRSCVERRLGR